MAKESRLQEDAGVFAIPKNVRPVMHAEYARFVQPMGEALAGEVGKEVEAIILRDYPNHVWFAKSNCYRQGEKGSSLDLNVVRESVLRQEGLGLPSLLEGKYLDEQRALNNRVYREYGLQIASESNPNAEIGKHLIAEANNRGWKLPLVVPSYNPLGHRKGESGFEIYFLGDKEGIDLEKEVIHGEKAREFLSANFNPSWIGQNGVLRLLRSRNGIWGAGWGDRGSDGDGRGDFVSGEASAENLQALKGKELNGKYDSVKKELLEQRSAMDARIAKLTNDRENELRAFFEGLKG